MKTTDFSNEYLDDVLKIEQASFARPWTAEMFLSSAKNPSARFKIVVDENAAPNVRPPAAAFCIFWIIGEETEILNVAVAPEKRRTGLAKEMLKLIIELSKKENSRSIFLEVDKKNRPAFELYISFGFKQIAERKNYYGRNDAAVLRLDINKK